MSILKSYKPNVLTAFGVLFLISSAIVPIQNLVVWGPDFVFYFLISPDITAEKLSIAGFDNLMSIAVASPGELTEIAGVTESVARKIINTARNKLDMGFESGEENKHIYYEIFKEYT